MMIKSLAATEGLEWENVDIKDPGTWKNVESELIDTFTVFAQQRIMKGVMQANGLDESMLEQARESFLAGHPLQPA